MDTTFNYSGFVDMFLSPEERAQATVPGTERAAQTPPEAAAADPSATRSAGPDRGPRPGS